jgi:hypothetical protein
MRHASVLCLALWSAARPAPARPAAAGEVWTASARPLSVKLDRSMLAEPEVRWVELAADATSGTSHRFVVGAPESTLGMRPLVLFLHGGGGSRDLLERLECLVMPAFAELAPIVVAPEGGRGEWWQPEEYPERFSAAIPMASNHTIVGESPLPVFAIHGSHDDLFDAASVQESIAALAARNFDVQLLVKARGTHMDPCAYLPELRAAAEWLHGDVWRRPRRSPHRQ